jgi:exodeoxyribonuclease VII large subunit
VSLHFRKVGQLWVIFGRTFENRKAIQAIGARYNGADKTWNLPATDENKEKVASLCLTAGGGEVRDSRANDGAEPTADVSPTKLASVTPTTEPAAVPQGMSIKDLMSEVKMTISRAFADYIWVYGDIHNLNNRGRMIYLNLTEAKDADRSQGSYEVKANIWQNQWQDLERKHGAPALAQIVQEGMRVRVLVQVQFYQERGQISLNIIDIDPSFTKGVLALARENLLKELKAQGLDRKNKELRMSPFPFVVGLLTAEGSRAFGDFTDQLKTGGFCGRVIYQAAQMQGERTVSDVVTGISQLEAAGVDVIVITRGGGSAADLRWFDDKRIAIAIAQATVPVVAAIGHHDDESVAEVIAHQREKTPTAAAEFILDIFRRTREHIFACSERITTGAKQRVEHAESKLMRLHAELGNGGLRQIMTQESRLQRMWQGLSQGLNHIETTILRMTSGAESRLAQVVEQFFHREERRLLFKQQDMERSTDKALQQSSEKLLVVEGRLNAQDPSPWLDRGWTQLRSNSGKLTSVIGLKHGELISARLRDGQLGLVVQDIREKK